MSKSIKRYLPFHSYLIQRELQRRQKLNSRYSLRSFANDLGVRTTALSDLFNNTRNLSVRGCSKILAALSKNLTDSDIARFINSVVEINAHQTAQKLAATAPSRKC
jgi:hypothetical protein